MKLAPALHIFNPETEFALGHGGNYFTPKASIALLRSKMSLLPTEWAEPNDYILLLDDLSPETLREMRTAANTQHIHLITKDELKSQPISFSAIRPWGWNASLKQLLLNCGITKTILPTEKQIVTLRQLAHRRNTIAMHRLMNTPEELIPQELTSLDDAIQWCHNNPGGYLKAPWSSSGRGIFRALPGSGKELTNWIVGTLARQHSIMAEPDRIKKFDFATEWQIANGKARFLGYSLFHVDNHSQYSGNSSLRQSEILEQLTTAGWNNKYLQLQKHALQSTIGNQYSGPVGLDALYSPISGFDLCVEINLRMTMGIVTLIQQKIIKHSDLYDR